MVYDITTRLSDSTIESNAELIAYLLERAKNKKSNKEFSGSISRFLLAKEKMPYMSTYCLVGSKYALGCLVGHFLYHYISEENLSKQIDLLSKLLEYVNGLQPSQNILLKKTTTVKLIDVLDKFGLPSYFLRSYINRPLRIYLIPYMDADLNGAYYPYLNSIVSYRPRLSDLDPEYVFMHEVGHLLAFNLTGDPEKVPDSFVEFNKVFNPTWDGELLEVFVDLFSGAVMMDTEYASKNPILPIFSIERQQVTRDYFIKLMGALKYKDSIVYTSFRS